jgi:hypothetical protein
MLILFSVGATAKTILDFTILSAKDSDGNWVPPVKLLAPLVLKIFKNQCLRRGTLSQLR